jgi:hypothetical protein
MTVVQWFIGGNWKQSVMSYKFEGFSGPLEAWIPLH